MNYSKSNRFPKDRENLKGNQEETIHLPDIFFKKGFYLRTKPKNKNRVHFSEVYTRRPPAITVLHQSYLGLKKDIGEEFARKALLYNLKSLKNNRRATAKAMSCSAHTIYLALEK